MSAAAEPRDWSGYYTRTAFRPPRETLVKAVDAFEREGGPGFAVDLGCGGGRDAVELLRRGWHVLAVDAESAAVERLAGRADLPASGRLQTRTCRFEDLDLPRADLVNAGFSLPHCPPEAFARIWRNIAGSLAPRGRFAGQLYGDRDQWFGEPGLTFFSRVEVEALLAGFEIEFFREEEDDAVTPRGRAKHWHIFHVTARFGATFGPSRS